MPSLLRFTLAAALYAAALNGAHAQESQRRFSILKPEEMTPAQRDLIRSIQSGPRASVQGSAANQTGGSIGSPFNVFLRSPELGEDLQKVGSYIRFKSTLGPKLSELAILVTARYWTAQYEWHAHHRLALQAGLDPKIAEEIAQGRRPAGMKPDEEAVYTFSHELHHNKRVSDDTYRKVRDLFGEQGVMDLMAVNGYYSLVSMILNVDRTPIPNGGPDPLPVLK
ncbi:MAG: carboxymuconolactone decarboxylase family protein [Burkholderiales bacterium]|nr:carboxymuconolactone decarboxylase family protein [Burkholderiales bacterium]